MTSGIVGGAGRNAIKTKISLFYEVTTYTPGSVQLFKVFSLDKACIHRDK